MSHPSDPVPSRAHQCEPAEHRAHARGCAVRHAGDRSSPPTRSQQPAHSHKPRSDLSDRNLFVRWTLLLRQGSLQRMRGARWPLQGRSSGAQLHRGSRPGLNRRRRAYRAAMKAQDRAAKPARSARKFARRVHPASDVWSPWLPVPRARVLQRLRWPVAGW